MVLSLRPFGRRIQYAGRATSPSEVRGFAFCESGLSQSQFFSTPISYNSVFFNRSTEILRGLCKGNVVSVTKELRISRKTMSVSEPQLIRRPRLRKRHMSGVVTRAAATNGLRPVSLQISQSGNPTAGLPVSGDRNAPDGTMPSAAL